MSTNSTAPQNDEITMEDIKNWLTWIAVVSVFVMIFGIAYQTSAELQGALPGYEEYAQKGVSVGGAMFALSMVLLNAKHICIYGWRLIRYIGKGMYWIVKKICKYIVKKRMEIWKRKKAEPEQKVVERTAEQKTDAKYPPVTLLDSHGIAVEEGDSQRMKGQLQQALREYELNFLTIKKVEQGPTITRFVLQMSAEGRFNKINSLKEELRLFLGVESIMLRAGADGVILEIPNDHPQTVYHRELMEVYLQQRDRKLLEIPIGKTATGELQRLRIDKCPHLLIAGQTGSGKSVAISIIVNSILMTAAPEEVKFLMIDPKVVELSIYNGIPHLLTPVITDPIEAGQKLEWVVEEMENRYKILAEAGYREIESYNANTKAKNKKLPHWIILIDELADLMMVAKKHKEFDVEESICRLGQKARAAGIHMVIATQRPSVDVITGLIKANVPARIAFSVASQVDSRTIIDAVGAEKLLGKGDGLIYTTEMKAPTRFQCSFICDGEIMRVTNWWKGEKEPTYDQEKEEVDYKGITSNTVEWQQEDAKGLNVQVELRKEEKKDVEGDFYYYGVKEYVANLALEDEEEVFLPSNRELAEALGFSRPYILQQLNKLIEEGWIEKQGDTPRTIKYMVLVAQEEAAGWIVRNEK